MKDKLLREEIYEYLSNCKEEIDDPTTSMSQYYEVTDMILELVLTKINKKILQVKKKGCCVGENPTAHDIALYELQDLKSELRKRK